MRFLLLLGLLPSVVLAQVVDVSTSKNATTVKGLSPHVNFIDLDGNDYFITTNGNVIRIHSNASPLINIPTDGNLGIELAAITGVAAVAVAGGSLAPSTTYYFVVTALDGFGETSASNEATCTTTVTNKSCQISWSISPPPASSYRIYIGTATGAYTHYVGGILTSPYTVSSFPINAGSPPEVTTAYRVRLSQAGIHYSDGTIQNTAGGAAAWSIDSSNIFSAQPGRLGIGDGFVFSLQAAKVNILCGNVGDGVNNGHCINLNNRGSVAAYLVNDIQIRSNLNPSSGLLYDTSKSSWIFALGNNGDRVAFYRAAPTGGVPSFQEIFSFDNNTQQLLMPRYSSAVFGQLSSLAGTYTFYGGASSTVNVHAQTSGDATLKLIAPSNNFEIRTFPSTNTGITYNAGLYFTSTAAKLISMDGSTGNLVVHHGAISAVGNISTFGHVWGASMSKACTSNSFSVNYPSSATDVASVNVTLSTSSVVPFITASINGTILSQNDNSRALSVNIIRNVTLVGAVGPIDHKSAASLRYTPISASRPLIDTSFPVGSNTYKISLNTGGNWNASNYIYGDATICVAELP